MKRKIKIGIDIDGVCRDFGQQFAKFAKEFYDITVTADDFKDFGFKNVKKPNGKLVITDVFVNQKAAEYVFGNAPVIENAFTGYKMFVDNDMIDVYVVSTQKKEHEQISLDWLEKHGFDKHIKTFFFRNKLKAPVQILIDDKIDHILKYRNNNRAGVLINQPYNQGPARIKLLSEGRWPEPYPDIYFSDDLIDAYKTIKTRYL